MQHADPLQVGVIPEADTAVAMIGAWIRTRTGLRLASVHFGATSVADALAELLA
jgi:hypothetical protein